MKYLILICFISTSLWAKSVTKKVQVQNFQWDQERSLFRLELHGHAGAYFISEKYLSCVKNSVVNKKPASLTYDVHTLIISHCQ